MKYKYLVFVFWICFQTLSAQSGLVKIDANIETESYHRTIVLDSKINFLRAVISKEVTEKKYLLSQYDTELNLIWENIIKVNQYHNVL